jgi:hypothetical protein
MTTAPNGESTEALYIADKQGMLLDLLEYKGGQPAVNLIGVPLEKYFKPEVIDHVRQKIRQTIDTHEENIIYVPNIHTSRFEYRELQFKRRDKNTIFLSAKTINHLPPPLHSQAVKGYVKLLIDNNLVIQHAETYGEYVTSGPISKYFGGGLLDGSTSINARRTYPNRAIEIIAENTATCLRRQETLWSWVEANHPEPRRFCSFSPINHDIALVYAYVFNAPSNRGHKNTQAMCLGDNVKR